MKGIRTYTPGEALNAAFGLKGFEELTSETGSTGYLAVKPVGGAATFSAVTPSYSDDFSSREVAEGVSIEGPFESVTVTAGTVLAYKV